MKQNSQPLCVLVFYVPESHLAVVKEAVFAAGAGHIGSYDLCCWEVQGQGQFRPLPGSQPHVGVVGSVEKVREYRVETVCPAARITEVIAALRDTHPYETVAFAWWPVNGEYGNPETDTSDF